MSTAGVLDRQSCWRQLAWTLVLCGAIVACGARSGLPIDETDADDEDGQTGGSAVTNGALGSSGASGNPACAGNGGPAMVRLPEGYCIDSTEITRAQYQAWLESNPSSSGQRGACTRNTTFAPEPTCMADAYVCQGQCNDHPQVCVDWCDAYAYCEGMGKHLCGKIGGGSISTDIPYDWVRADVSEWFNACSSHDVFKYVYGNLFQPDTCNGVDLDLGTTVPVGTLAGCQSAVPEYAGVYDLLGNVAEWENSCLEPGFGCRLRGSDFYRSSTGRNPDSPDRAPCGQDGADHESNALWYVGFRCCS